MNLGTPPAVCAALPPTGSLQASSSSFPRHLPGNSRWKAAARPVTPGDRLDRFGGMSRKRPSRAGAQPPTPPFPGPSAPAPLSMRAREDPCPGEAGSTRPQTCLCPWGAPRSWAARLIPTCWRGCGPSPRDTGRQPLRTAPSRPQLSRTVRVHHHQLGETMGAFFCGKRPVPSCTSKANSHTCGLKDGLGAPGQAGGGSRAGARVQLQASL